MMLTRASERVRGRATAFLLTRTSYRSGREDATTANCASPGAKAEAILASLLRKSNSFMAVFLFVLSIDSQERVLLGPDWKRDELVGDRREATTNHGETRKTIILGKQLIPQGPCFNTVAVCKDEVTRKKSHIWMYGQTLVT